MSYVLETFLACRILLNDMSNTQTKSRENQQIQEERRAERPHLRKEETNVTHADISLKNAERERPELFSRDFSNGFDICILLLYFIFHTVATSYL